MTSTVTSKNGVSLRLRKNAGPTLLISTANWKECSKTYSTPLRSQDESWLVASENRLRFVTLK
jgi:hypothetical protein